MNALPAHRDDWGNWGAAMQLLPNEAWRLFVYSYVRQKPRRGALVAAARAAGFCKNSTPANAAKLAWKMAHDERVIAAISEESRKILRVAFPEGANALLNLVRDPEHKDHGRAIALLLERTMPAETRHHVEILHKTVDPDIEALEELRALRAIGATREKMVELFGSNGLARLERLEAADNLRRANEAKVIEHSVSEAAHEQTIVEPIDEPVEHIEQDPDDDEVTLEVVPEDDF